jgi:hypothetical protein
MVDVGNDRKVSDVVHVLSRVPFSPVPKGSMLQRRNRCGGAQIAVRFAGAVRRAETKKKARPKGDAPSNKSVWQLLVGPSL